MLNDLKRKFSSYSMRLKEELKMECHKKRNLCFTCIHFCPLMPPLSTYGYKWQEMCVITGRTFLFMIFFDCHNSVHPFWGGAKESLLPKRLFLTRDGLSRPITHSAGLRLLAFNSILIKTPANPYLARFPQPLHPHHSQTHCRHSESHNVYDFSVPRFMDF